MNSEIDLPELQADDKLLDQLSKAEEIAVADCLTAILEAWRDDVDDGIFPEPIPQHVVAAVTSWRRCA